MNRMEKIEKVEKIIEQIVEKYAIIEKETKELKELEEKLKAANTSEMPVLLFTIDETLPMADDFKDYEYENVYYFPDLDIIKNKFTHERESFLPNTIDMRDFFKNMGVPKKRWPGQSYEFNSQIDCAISMLRAMIDELASTTEINSWEDFAALIKVIPNVYESPKYVEAEEEQVKSLKKIKKN